jgi:hypothetical protein
MRPNKVKNEHKLRDWVRGRPYNEHLYYRRETKKRLRRERRKVKARS